MQMLCDETLMIAVMGGDKTALTILIERHHGLLLGYLYRLVNGDHPLAEDLCQETFYRLLQQRNYKVGYLFKPWLYAIATNLARDHLKSPATHTLHQQNNEEGKNWDINDPDPGPEEQAQAAEQRQEVADAIAQLNEEYRVTLLLRFYQGFSLQEIAETLHLPIGTVKSRLSAGTRRLRELLAYLREEVGER
jgi:RNA polymerase sigma-70 factor, ECF subfamily